MKPEYVADLIAKLRLKPLDKLQLSKLKTRLCEKHKVKEVPTDIAIMLAADPVDSKFLKKFLQIKPVRGLSGVTVCAVMTKPRACPHGSCVYCPGGPKSFFGSVPQSYTGKEPATRRALRNNFDPYLQLFNRLEQYVCSGHLPEKIELIIMGGTFPSYPVSYQKSFVSYLFKALNDFSREFFTAGELDIVRFRDFFELPGGLDDNKRAQSIRKKVLKLKSESTLQVEQVRNKTSIARCVGLTIETRPDYATLKQANLMLELGCTRVELGVQSLDNEILKRIERGHDVKETIRATRTLKDLGFKINYHMMLGLPGARDDLAMFKTLFSDSDYQPDMLKIYPCMVMEGTKLYDDWKKGSFKPLTTETAAKIIAKIKSVIPSYVRIMRVQRDIPTNVTVAGVDRTNLRQYVAKVMEQTNQVCKCIRCREIRGKRLSSPEVKIIQYPASLGKEFFISLEQDDAIIGFCRLRFPSSTPRKEITKDSALVRELHVYGQTVRIGRSGSVQHRGFGKLLLKKAEELAQENHKKKIVIISGVGVREYYRKFGYRLDGPYMVKGL